MAAWRRCESKIFTEFKSRFPADTIEFDQRLLGKLSGARRQVDILVKAQAAGCELIGVFDCKLFRRRVDVKAVDSMVGFMQDVGATFGGIVSTREFSKAAKKRAAAAGIDLRIIPFDSPATVVEHFVPSLDFSDPRKSGYIAVI